MYTADFTYKLTMFGNIEVNSNDPAEAEELIKEHLNEIGDTDYEDLEIESIRSK